MKRAYDIQVSGRFLELVGSLSKMQIKVYLSLAYTQRKRGKSVFHASHREISTNMLEDGKGYMNVNTDNGRYFEAVNRLKELGLIRVEKRLHPNGKILSNRYELL